MGRLCLNRYEQGVAILENIPSRHATRRGYPATHSLWALENMRICRVPPLPSSYLGSIERAIRPGRAGFRLR